MSRKFYIKIFKASAFFIVTLVVSLQLISAQNLTSSLDNETINFKITTLNTEWLSCSTYGPSDDALQINNIASLISVIDPDVIALQEVGTSTTYPTINLILSKLGSEWGGNIVTNDNSNCGQNQGIIYKKSKVQFVNSSLITNGGTSYNWSSGRYPALYNLLFTVGDGTIPISLINIHAKAYSDETSYLRREGAAEGLKTLLDGSSYNTKNIILLGDYNDYLVGSQCSSETDSPYKNFVDDTSNYMALTSSLIDPYYNSPVIDNIIISNELVYEYVANSTLREVAATQQIANYRATTSDHTPVSATFLFNSSTGLPSTNDNSQISLFPNPARDYFSIKSDLTIKYIMIYNVAGVQVLSYEYNSEKIDISRLPQGVYIIHLFTENRYYQKKLVKY